MKIDTIGHSTRPIEDFLEILHAHQIATLVDVRSIPGSRRNPQYSQKTLEKTLEESGVAYRWLKDLGGLRKAKLNSKNTGWRNASFRGYADYMQSEAFEAALQELVVLAKDNCVCIMCAEALWWRCHRSLIADALEAKGVAVHHIHSKTSAPRHKIKPFAKIENGKVFYPA